MAAKGFKIGDVVKHRKTDVWALFKIQDINKDTIDLNPFDEWEGTLNQSELTKVQTQTFIKEWTHTLKTIEEYAGTAISASDVDPLVFKAMVTSCMGELMNQDRSSVRIFKSPELSVFSVEAYETNTLVIVPATKTIIAHDDKDGDLNSKAILVTVEGHYFKLGQQQDKKCYAAFWCLEVNHERNKCNLELVDKTMFTKRPSITTPNNNTIVTVNFPVAVNFKPIKERERLVLYRPAVAKPVEKKREAPLVLAGGKKAKK